MSVTECKTMDLTDAMNEINARQYGIDEQVAICLMSNFRRDMRQVPILKAYPKVRSGDHVASTHRASHDSDTNDDILYIISPLTSPSTPAHLPLGSSYGRLEMRFSESSLMSCCCMNTDMDGTEYHSARHTQ